LNIANEQFSIRRKVLCAGKYVRYGVKPAFGEEMFGGGC